MLIEKIDDEELKKKKQLLKELKKKLHEGEVKFTYVKKNGEVRPARGTLAESLVPSNPNRGKVKVKVSGIVYNDQHDVEFNNLPESTIVYVKLPAEDTPDFDKVVDKLVIEATEEAVGGFAVDTLNYVLVKPKTLPDDSVFYYDLDKCSYRSFNIIQLVSIG